MHSETLHKFQATSTVFMCHFSMRFVTLKRHMCCTFNTHQHLATFTRSVHESALGEEIFLMCVYVFTVRLLWWFHDMIFKGMYYCVINYI